MRPNLWIYLIVALVVGCLWGTVILVAGGSWAAAFWTGAAAALAIGVLLAILGGADWLLADDPERQAAADMYGLDPRDLVPRFGDWVPSPDSSRHCLRCGKRLPTPAFPDASFYRCSCGWWGDRVSRDGAWLYHADLPSGRLVCEWAREFLCEPVEEPPNAP